MVEPKNPAAQILLGYCSHVKRGYLLKKLCCSESTFCVRMRKPSTIRLDELAVMVRELHITQEDLMRLVRSVR